MGSKKILIVDDQPGIRLLLTDILENEGYLVQTASTGKEAMEELYKQTLDLILLDYRLPVLDGSEVLKKMEEEHMDIPAIVISGMIENITSEGNIYSHTKAVIGKPFDVLELSGLIKKILYP
ncbi:response regulator [Oceanobacillus piezotolerans]|uniref:Response regulator n=1 Tax=Oceanobacillus piezotolerans TaxID=2448030 RepID=A0A498D649_9BACI|nr:response regulator [Oceanobacillus piezotolerans]RLL42870.1 response regulator [Oceanobacillus piezotolerans]